MKIKFTYWLVVALALAATTSSRAGFSERKKQEVADSAQPQRVKGGETFTFNSSYAAAFDAIVLALKHADEEIAQADRDSGRIATEITITGGWRQTGTRTVISLVKESETVTTVKVAVTEQKRYKALQVEPWSDPSVNAEKSQQSSVALRHALGIQ